MSDNMDECRLTRCPECGEVAVHPMSEVCGECGFEEVSGDDPDVGGDDDADVGGRGGGDTAGGVRRRVPHDGVDTTAGAREARTRQDEELTARDT